MKPTNLQFKRKSRLLAITWPDGDFELSFEFLRVHSPSAEVKGHGGIGGQLPFGKQDVNVEKAEPAGNYGIRIYFDDGHNSGIYSFDTLHELAHNQEELWQHYVEQLHEKGLARAPESQVVTLFSPKGT